jgi:glyoxylase-like metal-dependent hydrolase (beta-lactamase superfamily II)
VAAAADIGHAKRVAEGVWAIGIPRPSGGDAARLYAIDESDGVYLVDAGWSSPASSACFRSGLEEAGLGLDRVKGVLLTHLHPDHCGLANEIRAETGAWVAANPLEVAAATYRHGPDAPFLSDLSRWLPAAGVPGAEAEFLIAARRSIGDDAPVLALDREISDGDVVRLGGRELVALLTPGHSAGHLCFLDRRLGQLFAGDVVLPERLPPVGSYSLDVAHDPIARFFESLDRVAALDGALILPGHGDAFTGPRADAERIRAHHERRMGALLDFLDERPATLWEATLAAPWTRPWRELAPFAQLLALGKVNAHLGALVNRGLARRLDGDQLRFAR